MAPAGVYGPRPALFVAWKLNGVVFYNRLFTRNYGQTGNVSLAAAAASELAGAMPASGL